MIKKKTSEKNLSDKDKKDWKNFVNSTSEIPNKDNLENTKTLHSKSGSNVYISEEFSKLKNTIPDFIKNNPEINAKVKIIKQADKNLGGSGAILIKLKRIIK